VRDSLVLSIHNKGLDHNRRAAICKDLSRRPIKKIDIVKVHTIKMDCLTSIIRYKKGILIIRVGTIFWELPNFVRNRVIGIEIDV